MNRVLRQTFFGILFLASSFFPAISWAEMQSEVGAIYLTMDELDAEVIFRKEYNDKSSFPVSVIEARDPSQSLALTGRIKVSGSFSRRFKKKNLIIELENGQRSLKHGQSRISLDAVATDGSLLREWLAWQLIHDLGMVAPKIEFVRLYINDQYRGIFMQTEWIDTKLFDRSGLGKNGQFFHPIDSKFCGDFRYYDDKTIERCWFKFSPEDKDFSPLSIAYQQINETSIENFDQYLQDHFDVDSVINWLVVNVLTSNGDTYNKNYFMYQAEATKKWTVIPWDFDLTFGRNWDPVLPFPDNILNDNFQYYYPPQLGAVSPLKEKTLRNPELNKQFKDRLLHLLGIKKLGSETTFGWFSPEQLNTRIDRMTSLLEPHRREDPFLRKQEINFPAELQSLRHYAQRRHAYLKETLAGEYQWNAEKATWNYDEEQPQKPYPRALRVRETVPENGKFEMISAPAYGYSLAGIKLRDRQGSAEFSTESEMDQPPIVLPPDYPTESCIQRNWYLTLMSPFQNRTMALQLEYLQENSQRNEIGSLVSEPDLTLWALDGQEWNELETQFNPLSNVFTVRSLTMKPGTMLRFAACSAEVEKLQ